MDTRKEVAGALIEAINRRKVSTRGMQLVIGATVGAAALMTVLAGEGEATTVKIKAGEIHAVGYIKSLQASTPSGTSTTISTISAGGTAPTQVFTVTQACVTQGRCAIYVAGEPAPLVGRPTGGGDEGNFCVTYTPGRIIGTAVLTCDDTPAPNGCQCFVNGVDAVP